MATRKFSKLRKPNARFLIIWMVELSASLAEERGKGRAKGHGPRRDNTSHETRALQALFGFVSTTAESPSVPFDHVQGARGPGGMATRDDIVARAISSPALGFSLPQRREGR